MSDALKNVETEYARHAQARRAFFVPAQTVLAALASLGIVRAGDALTVFGEDAAAIEGALPQLADIHIAAEPTADTFRALSGDVSAGTRLFWFVPTLGGNGLRVADLRALGAAARDAGALLLVDNSVPGPYGCQPLGAGAHVAFERIATGEPAESIFAVSVARSALKRNRIDASAEAAWELLEGASSADFSPRAVELLEGALDEVEKTSQSRFDHARAMAEYFAANEMVADTCYPGLKGHPDRAVAANVLMHGAGPVLEVELTEGASAAEFLDGLPDGYRSRGDAPLRMTACEPVSGNPRRLRIFAGADDPLRAIDAFDAVLRGLVATSAPAR